MGKKSSKKKLSNKRKERDITPTSKPQAKEEKRGIPRKWYFFLAVIGVITLASYLNSLNNRFVFDDIPLIRNNRTIKGIEKIPRLLGIGKGRGSYRPIRMVSYALDYTLNKKLWQHFGSYGGRDKGLNPLGYHISNIVYHIVTSFLVFLVVYSLAGTYRLAFLAASLFALHPVHTDSVTYLSGRRDILFTLFYLAGFYFFLCYRKTRKTRFIIASFLAYLLSLGSKEMGVTLPAIFLCYDLVENSTVKAAKINLTYFKELASSLKKVIVKYKYLYSIIFLAGIAYSYYKIFINSPSHQSYYYGQSMFTTFLTVGKILVHYMKLMVYPIILNADYYYDAFPLSSSFLEPSTFFSFMFLGVVGYTVLRLLVNHKMLAFGGIWFFVTLLPVCHIIPHHELLAEHYLYLPSFGFCLIVAFLVNSILREGRYSYFIYASFIGIVLLFSLRIVDRNRDWRNKFTLWDKTVKTAPRCARAQYNLGSLYNKVGRLDKAISHFKNALAVKPNYALAHYNLGVAYRSKGRLDEAISEYKKTLTIKHDHVMARVRLGAAYSRKKMFDKAITEYLNALAVKPNYALAHYNLGNAYRNKGELDEAISHFKKALAIKPNFAEAQYNLEMAYSKKREVR